jgi:cytoskeleton protein RodZ
MTKTGFGEHLKREREMRGVSLDEICAATRIGTRFLQAMETEEWERLPGGVFNRGFVRAVARYLGLDEEGMVAEYVMAMNQGSATPPGTAQQENRLLQKQTNWLPWIGAAFSVLLIAAVWLGWHFYSVRRDRARAAQSSAAFPAAAQPSEQPTAGAAPASPGTLPPNAPSAPAASSSASPAADKLELKIEAGKTTSVTVIADAKVVFNGTFIPGQSRTFEAENQFDVAAKDAGALLLELNGKTLAPIGPPGHRGKVSLTRRTLDSAAGGTN